MSAEMQNMRQDLLNLTLELIDRGDYEIMINPEQRMAVNKPGRNFEIGLGLAGIAFYHEAFMNYLFTEDQVIFEETGEILDDSEVNELYDLFLKFYNFHGEPEY